MTDKPSKPAAKKPKARKPNPTDATTSSTGEEDPGASLGDPALRDAMQGEARVAGQQATPKARRRDAEEGGDEPI